MAVFLELPISVVQGANLSRFQPSGDAVEVERVVAHSPGHRALFWRSRRLIGLAFDAQVHDVIPTNGTVVNDDVPCPQSNSIPFLYFESRKQNLKMILQLFLWNKQYRFRSPLAPLDELGTSASWSTSILVGMKLGSQAGDLAIILVCASVRRQRRNPLAISTNLNTVSQSLKVYYQTADKCFALKHMLFYIM